jgi:hypothetical protein
MNIDDDNDELLLEIDVYLAGELSNELYLFQYPLRAVERPYGDQGELTNVQYNSTQTDTTIKFNYNVDSKSKNFDISGEQKVLSFNFRVLCKL